jgi:formylmethanofuran dehydrogenase subunit E
MPQCDHCEDEVERTWAHPLSDEWVCRECHPVVYV